jgi:chromosome segregation ATPase
MTLKPAFRRLAVTAGLAVAVLAAAGTILAASQWAATEAALAVAPVTIQSVQQALDQERARSAALEQQLAALEGGSEDLSTALAAAQAQLTTDAATATDLRAALEAAQAKLAKLEAALKAAAEARTTITTSTRVAVSEDRHEEEEHEDEEEHEADDD